MGKVGDALYLLLIAVPFLIVIKFAVTVVFGATNILFGMPRLPMYLPSLVDWLLPVDRSL